MKKLCIFIIMLLLISNLCIAQEQMFDGIKYVVTDAETRRDINVVNVNNHNTARPYFTQGMWTSDSKRIILSDTTDRYLYEYNTETNKLRKLIKSGADIYVTPTDNLYYVDSSDKSIKRMNLNTYEIKKIANYLDATSTPGSIHVNNDDTKLVVLWTESANELDFAIDTDENRVKRVRRIPILDIKTGKWDLRYTHEFPSPLPHLSHSIINPEYSDLVFFCHEGSTNLIPDRLWTLNTTTGEQKNIFKQYYNFEGNTGETSGHENWTADGEHLVFVKYTRATNLGQSGIVRINKNGEEREYINGNYSYWHCHPSSDNRWIVADTQERLSIDEKLGFNTGMTDIVMVDSKTSSSTRIARVKIGGTHPWQPHPAFSPDGKKVAFSMISKDSVLSVGIMNVEDIVNDEQAPVMINKNTNENHGFTASPVSKIGFEHKTVITNSAESKEFMFIAARYEHSVLKEMNTSIKTVQKNSKVEFKIKLDSEAGDVKYFLWNQEITPYHLTPTQPEKLRMVGCSNDSIMLAWFPSRNLDDIKGYEIYRNKVKIAEVTDPYYRDYGLSHDTSYNYEIKTMYNNMVSPSEYGTFKTLGEAKVVFSQPTEEKNMKFVDMASITADSYTEAVFYEGRNCRKSTRQVQENGTVKTGKFYFRVDKNYISAADNRVTFQVTYLDEGTGTIRIQYNSPTNIAENKVIAVRGNTNQWKTASMTIDDARFVGAPALTNSDFRIEGGENTYISEVQVSKTSNAEKIYQNGFADFGTGEIKGLAPYIVETRGDCITTEKFLGGRKCRYAPSGKNFYFNVDDSYMFGKSFNEAAITIRYFDEGIGNVMIQYNSGDSTMTGNTAYKTSLFVKKTNTGIWKEKTIKIIDADFTNLQDSPYNADFRLYSKDGLALEFVKVLSKI